ncbi:hypothetical protein Tsubulata_047585 [Turnera subulata]|uniref:Signal recognition particle 19 kDa protein n=1 Tax=Turnera subulata TaxID=218843 RepID=A0A9Q0IZZ1_9ROSI|nr:hypothetical protein Tsubulata_047585 [Turnera subulata]
MMDGVGGDPNIKKWVVLYPVYINSKKTLAEGRRIRTEKACENPTCVEIGDCCHHLKVPYVIEIDKAYPRDFMQVGRVRSWCLDILGGLRSRKLHPHQMLDHPSQGKEAKRRDKKEGLTNCDHGMQSMETS